MAHTAISCVQSHISCFVCMHIDSPSSPYSCIPLFPPATWRKGSIVQHGPPASQLKSVPACFTIPVSTGCHAVQRTIQRRRSSSAVWTARACITTPAHALAMGTGMVWVQRWACPQAVYMQGAPWGWRACSPQNGSCGEMDMLSITIKTHTTRSKACP